jgi:hypothetical protein
MSSGGFKHILAQAPRKSARVQAMLSSPSHFIGLRIRLGVATAGCVVRLVSDARGIARPLGKVKIHRLGVEGFFFKKRLSLAGS